MLTADLLKQLQKPLSLSPQCQVSALRAGQVNQVFLLVDGQQRWVVKSLSQDTFSGVDRQQQFALQQRLSELGVAPAPIWMDAGQTLWVEAFVEHNLISPADEHQQIEQMARALAKIHTLPVDHPPLNLAQRLTHYATKAGLETGSHLLSQCTTLLPHCRQQAIDPEHLALCHNDLSYGHVMSVSPVMLVDWEYAAVGSCFFDLAACAGINHFSRSARQRLIHCYAEASGRNTAQCQQQFDIQYEVVTLTAQLWQAALDASQICHN
ncbi:choline/ethanolamine kinase family protein [Salinimonas lutimaris]|uniref:choline/ethanolamine kinase family protein n=1 Tax=Salinimonas lutimaris TaxID=914153 RepID=UPI0010C01434|nr:choline/ethanolamine kinase family protein [Salinimonas lutimaris]